MTTIRELTKMNGVRFNALPLNLVKRTSYYDPAAEYTFNFIDGKDLANHLLSDTVSHVYDIALANLENRDLICLILAILPKWAYFEFLEKVKKHIPETNAERYGSVKRERTAA